MSTANRVIKNTGYLYAKMGITMFISLYTTRLILSSLGASDFGIFNIVGGAISMLGFLNAAMASATQRFMSYSEGEGDKQKQKSIFNISLVLHFSLAFIVALVLIAAGWFFFHGIFNIPAERVAAAKVVYACLVVSTMLTVMNVPYDAVMNAHENMRYYALVGVLESCLKLSVAFACVYTSHDRLIVYGALMAAIPLVTLTIMKVYCHRHYTECVIRPRTYWNTALFREIAAFAGWHLTFSMGSMMGSYGNGIVLNSFFGTILNAALGIANQLNGMLMVFSNSMLKALNPVIVKKEGEGDRAQMMEYSYTGCKMAFLLFACFCLPCIVETPYILKVWLMDYPEWAVLFVRWQFFKTLLEQMTITLGTSLQATGHIKEYSIWTFVLDLLPLLILSLAFAGGASPHWYFPLIIFIMVVLPTIMKFHYCRTYCGLRIGHFARQVLLPCFLTMGILLLVGFSTKSLMAEGIPRLLLSCLTMTAAFLLASWAMLNTRERGIVRNASNMLIRKIRRGG